MIIHDSSRIAGAAPFLTVPLLFVRTADFKFKTASFKFNSTTRAPSTSYTASTTTATYYYRIIVTTVMARLSKRKQSAGEMIGERERLRKARKHRRGVAGSLQR